MYLVRWAHQQQQQQTIDNQFCSRNETKLFVSEVQLGEITNSNNTHELHKEKKHTNSRGSTEKISNWRLLTQKQRELFKSRVNIGKLVRVSQIYSTTNE